MADIGLRYAAFARVQSHTEGSAITYGAGREVGMMISANAVGRLRLCPRSFQNRSGNGRNCAQLYRDLVV